MAPAAEPRGVRQRLLGYRPIADAVTGAVDFPYRDLRTDAYTFAGPWGWRYTHAACAEGTLVNVTHSPEGTPYGMDLTSPRRRADRFGPGFARYGARSVQQAQGGDRPG